MQINIDFTNFYTIIFGTKLSVRTNVCWNIVQVDVSQNHFYCFRLFTDKITFLSLFVLSKMR